MEQKGRCMTNAEISKWLANLKNDIGRSQYQPLWHYAEALDMAIEALEEQKWKVASKKLPEYHESVLTWDGVCYSVEKRIPYIYDDYGECIESDWWVSDDYDEEKSKYYPNLRDGTCIAWRRFKEYTEDNDG